MDLQDVQAPDIIFHIVRQLVDDLNAAGFSAGHSKFAQFLKDINEQLNREVEPQGLKGEADCLRSMARLGVLQQNLELAREAFEMAFAIYSIIGHAAQAERVREEARALEAQVTR